jgi:tetratricopeptide (TPR) repeat protein
MTDIKERYEQALKVFSEPPTNSGKQLMVAICLTKLGDYLNAQHFYTQSLRSSLQDRLWHLSGEPSRLVDTYVLADLSDVLPEVLHEVEEYKLDPRGDSLLPLYAYALACLIMSRDEKAGDYVAGLIKKPKIKDTFAMGTTIKAIIGRNQAEFDAALDDLLRAHRGRAKFGALRETPEGFLCLPAMSLAKMALQRSMNVKSESEYMSKGYLDYLLQRQDPLP